MNEELCILLQAIREAGQAILTFQRADFLVATKANNELVTEADIAANQILKKHLLTAFPQDGWLSEESIDNAERLTKKRTWIVDPIDGTKEYSKRIPEYALSVALVCENVPVLSAVYNPATEELFHAIKAEGAWLNDKKICCNVERTEALKLLASRSEFARGEWEKFNRYQLKAVGSIAYKLALIAKGDAHATFSLGQKNEWDVAAGTLLVEEAGGVVVDKFRLPLRFNQARVKIDGIVATALSTQEKVFKLIEK